MSQTMYLVMSWSCECCRPSDVVAPLLYTSLTEARREIYNSYLDSQTMALDDNVRIATTQGDYRKEDLDYLDYLGILEFNGNDETWDKYGDPRFYYRWIEKVRYTV